MAVSRKDFDDIRHFMGKKSAKEFVKASHEAKENALKRITSGKHGLYEIKNIEDYKKLHKPKHTK